jgi:transcriptional regulator with XRE-family HTH domain
MLSAAAQVLAPYRRVMVTRADPTPREQRDAMARAIKSLREQAGPGGKKLSTLAAAAKIGRTRQTWEKYENAKADVVLRQDVQDEIAQALSVSRQDLLDEYERRLHPGAGGAFRSHDGVPSQPPSLEFPAGVDPPA